MDASEELFHDEYKPVHIPAHFSATDTWRNKVIYALSLLGEATAPQTAEKLQELDKQTPANELQQKVAGILTGLFDKGLIKGSKNGQGEMAYNLSKMTETNTGEDTDADQR